ncbi:unnamed protein product, partial [marine sediment metagenome]
MIKKPLKNKQRIILKNKILLRQKIKFIWIKMVEIDLEDFEDFYKKKLNLLFQKIKKAAKKHIAEIRNELIEIKVCVDHFLEAGQEKIKAKPLRSLHLFSDRMKKEIEDIEIPEEIYYDKIFEYLNSIKKLFGIINEIARKTFPKFKKEVQTQIKELEYITRRLRKKHQIFEEFLRKKYSDVKNAEELLKKLPKLSN